MNRRTLMSFAACLAAAATLAPVHALDQLPEMKLVAQVHCTPDGGVVTIQAEGLWFDSCVPTSPEIILKDGEIRLRLVAKGDDCARVVTAWTAEAKTKPLANGEYRLILQIGDVLRHQGADIKVYCWPSMMPKSPTPTQTALDEPQPSSTATDVAHADPQTPDHSEHRKVDLNRDGAITSADISAFVTLWLAGIASGDHRADFNQDRTVDSSDMVEFIVAFATEVAC